MNGRKPQYIIMDDPVVWLEFRSELMGQWYVDRDAEFFVHAWMRYFETIEHDRAAAFDILKNAHPGHHNQPLIEKWIQAKREALRRIGRS